MAGVCVWSWGRQSLAVLSHLSKLATSTAHKSNNKTGGADQKHHTKTKPTTTTRGQNKGATNHTPKHTKAAKRAEKAKERTGTRGKTAGGGQQDKEGAREGSKDRREEAAQAKEKGACSSSGVLRGDLDHLKVNTSVQEGRAPEQHSQHGVEGRAPHRADGNVWKQNQNKLVHHQSGCGTSSLSDFFWNPLIWLFSLAFTLYWVWFRTEVLFLAFFGSSMGGSWVPWESLAGLDAFGWAFDTNGRRAKLTRTFSMMPLTQCPLPSSCKVWLWLHVSFNQWGPCCFICRDKLGNTASIVACGWLSIQVWEQKLYVFVVSCVRHHPRKVKSKSKTFQGFQKLVRGLHIGFNFCILVFHYDLWWFYFKEFGLSFAGCCKLSRL